MLTWRTVQQAAIKTIEDLDKVKTTAQKVAEFRARQEEKRRKARASENDSVDEEGKVVNKRIAKRKSDEARDADIEGPASKRARSGEHVATYDASPPSGSQQTHSPPPTQSNTNPCESALRETLERHLTNDSVARIMSDFQKVTTFPSLPHPQSH